MNILFIAVMKHKKSSEKTCIIQNYLVSLQRQIKNNKYG